VTALRAHADAIVASVLAENDGRWETLSERDRKRVEALARAIANRLLHEPTLRVKGLDASHRHARLQLLRELFGLDDAAPETAEQPAEVRALRPR
jgi:glutamyl-tRNA reductase